MAIGLSSDLAFIRITTPVLVRGLPILVGKSGFTDLISAYITCPRENLY